MKQEVLIVATQMRSTLEKAVQLIVQYKLDEQQAETVYKIVCPLNK